MAIKKKKFKPVITRVKLNPEQAVLACPCYSTNFTTGGTTQKFNIDFCDGKGTSFAESWFVSGGATSS